MQKEMAVRTSGVSVVAAILIFLGKASSSLNPEMKT